MQLSAAGYSKYLEASRLIVVQCLLLLYCRPGCTVRLLPKYCTDFYDAFFVVEVCILIAAGKLKVPRATCQLDDLFTNL